MLHTTLPVTTLGTHSQVCTGWRDVREARIGSARARWLSRCKVLASPLASNRCPLPHLSSEVTTSRKHQHSSPLFFALGGVLSTYDPHLAGGACSVAAAGDGQASVQSEECVPQHSLPLLQRPRQPSQGPGESFSVLKVFTENR